MQAMGPLNPPSYLQGETAAAAASSVRGEAVLLASQPGRLQACWGDSRWLLEPGLGPVPAACSEGRQQRKAG